VTITPSTPENPEVTSWFVAITGGPGSGKTSLVNHLGSLGYATVPEAGIQLIEELNRELGVRGQVEWRQGHRAEFQRRVMERMVALEAACTAAEGSLVFCDRGLPGALAYAELFGIRVDRDLRSLVDRRRYLQVFILDTLTDFPARAATGRTSDRKRSVRLNALLFKAYRSYGYSPIRVPELSIEERAQLVLSELGEPTGRSQH
jgi:predicted ATPase